VLVLSTYCAEGKHQWCGALNVLQDVAKLRTTYC